MLASDTSSRRATFTDDLVDPSAATPRSSTSSTSSKPKSILKNGPSQYRTASMTSSASTTRRQSSMAQPPSALANRPMRYAKAHELPSHPSVGIDLSKSNTAATLATDSPIQVKPIYTPPPLHAHASHAAARSHASGPQYEEFWRPDPAESARLAQALQKDRRFTITSATGSGAPQQRSPSLYSQRAAKSIFENPPAPPQKPAPATGHYALPVGHRETPAPNVATLEDAARKAAAARIAQIGVAAPSLVPSRSTHADAVSATTGAATASKRVLLEHQARLERVRAAREKEQAEFAHKHEVLVSAALRNVNSSLGAIDKNIRETTIWGNKEFTAAAMAHAEQNITGKYSANVGKVDLGGGLIMSPEEVHAIAQRHVQPVLDELHEKALEQREKDELARQERERIKAEKAEEKRIRDEEKAEQKRVRDVEKAEQKRIRDAEKAEQRRLKEEAKAEERRLKEEAKAAEREQKAAAAAEAARIEEERVAKVAADKAEAEAAAAATAAAATTAAAGEETAEVAEGAVADAATESREVEAVGETAVTTATEGEVTAVEGETSEIAKETAEEADPATAAAAVASAVAAAKAAAEEATTSSTLGAAETTESATESAAVESTAVEGETVADSTEDAVVDKEVDATSVSESDLDEATVETAAAVRVPSSEVTTVESSAKEGETAPTYELLTASLESDAAASTTALVNGVAGGKVSESEPTELVSESEDVATSITPAETAPVETETAEKETIVPVVPAVETTDSTAAVEDVAETKVEPVETEASKPASSVGDVEESTDGAISDSVATGETVDGSIDETTKVDETKTTHHALGRFGEILANAVEDAKAAST
ncbi:hypothetical protein BZA70DRAFT_71285 [Myxozyma melibiosi]|uniref:Uncharacterized protein n=1 Tax=Myxozyma melibiosi TaxID=54550 RepID=A0ABR1F1C6_9ASCO